MTDDEPTPAAFYPVALDVDGRACLVVGGGPVAARKARGLLDCGALVTVVAPSLAPEMEALTPLLHVVERRPFRPGDAAGFRLVLTATGRPDVDGAVYADAESHGVWVNSADDRSHCSFILPALYRDGAVTVAVSTGGLSPAMASWLRSRLAVACGDGLGSLARVLGEARARLRAEGKPVDAVDWAALLEGPLPALIAAGEIEQGLSVIRGATDV